MHRCPACGRAEDGHIARVAAVIRDVVAHPFQRQDLIAESIRRGPDILVAVLGQVQKTESPEQQTRESSFASLPQKDFLLSVVQDATLPISSRKDDR